MYLHIVNFNSFLLISRCIIDNTKLSRSNSWTYLLWFPWILLTTAWLATRRRPPIMNDDEWRGNKQRRITIRQTIDTKPNTCPTPRENHEVYPHPIRRHWLHHWVRTRSNNLPAINFPGLLWRCQKKHRQIISSRWRSRWNLHQQILIWWRYQTKVILRIMGHAGIISSPGGTYFHFQ